MSLLQYKTKKSKSETGRKTLHHMCLNAWKDISNSYRHCAFVKFKTILQKVSFKQMQL